ncbi:HD domain-containing protein [Pseudoxanthomonas sp. UTMC 1351]|uniref:HD domain-containing protein n=1 Tax=Pseudoxanthomonas sp. UTMC 1351 TaxID=2695853 RepID=UPI0034CD19D3
MQLIDKSKSKSPLHPDVSSLPVRTIAGIAVADTPLVKRAYEIAREHLDPYLFNHVMRSWLFATLIAEQKGDSYDAEVLAVSALLHDIGLSEAFVGPLRFEVEGANFAQELASSFNVDTRRAQLIWDSIALNSTPSICLHKEAEAALCVLGVGLDWGGWGYERLPGQQIARIMEEFPRLAMKQRFTQAICSLCEHRPETTYDNFARDFGARYVHGYEPPSMVDSLLSSPFEE